MYEAKTHPLSLGSIEKTSLKPPIEPITPLSKNKPQIQVVQFIVKLGKFIIYGITYVFVACTFSCIYAFYLVPLCRQGRTSTPPVFMTISLNISNKSSFLSAPEPKIANSFSSSSQYPSAVHSSISQGVSSSLRSPSHLNPNPEGTVVWAEKLKNVQERVIWKERRPSDAFCRPTFAIRQIDKRGAIRSSTRENFEKRDLSGGNTSDPNMVKYQAQVFVTSMTYACYYQVSMQLSRHLPGIIWTLPKLILLIRENTIEGFQNLPLHLQEKVAKAVPQVVPNLSNLESGLNMVEKFKSNTNQNEKTKMNLTERFKEGQALRLNKIENDPILIDYVLTAQNDDFRIFVSGGEGTRSRFKALKHICRKSKIDHFERCYKKGILYPIQNFTLAAGYLADWDANYPLSTGSDLFIQHMLQKTVAITRQESEDLQDRMSLEDSSVQQEPDFVVWRLVGQGMSCLDPRFKNAKKSVPANNLAFWKKKSKELISESFAEAFTELEKNGIPSDKLNNSLNKVLPQYLELEEED